ncbi:hypothetical protein ACLB2K_004236 [Fragaria x ananassa]
MFNCKVIVDRENVNRKVIVDRESALIEYMVTRDYVEWWSKAYCSMPKMTTATMPIVGSQHKPLKAKEDKIAARVEVVPREMPFHQGVVTREMPTRQRLVPREMLSRQEVVPREIELGNNPHASSIKALPPSSNSPDEPHQVEDHGDSSDHHLAQSHLKLKGTNTQAKRLSGSSNSSKDVNFKR